MGIKFAEGLHVLPVLAPLADSTSVGTDYLNIENAQWITYLVQFGAMTSDSTDTVTVTVECSTDSSSGANEISVPFYYRLSAAVGTDTSGTITKATASGVAVTATDDNKLLIIDIDPAEIAATTGFTDAHIYNRLWLSKNAELATNTIGVIAAIEPRYPGNTIPDIT
jgi:hypothetical protein